MTEVAINDVAQQTLIEHGLIGNVIAGIRSTLEWQTPEDDFARKHSTLRFMAQCFHRHLGRMMILEENEGYMDLVAATSPWLGRRVDGLRHEHGLLREATRQIVRRLDDVSYTDWDEFSSICEDLTGLLQRVEQHTRKEMALVQEAFAQDSGGEG